MGGHSMELTVDQYEVFYRCMSLESLNMCISHSQFTCLLNLYLAFRQNLDSIAMSMQGKMLEIRARQEGQRHRAAAEPSK